MRFYFLSFFIRYSLSAISIAPVLVLTLPLERGIHPAEIQKTDALPDESGAPS
jgi:hypothetical protein